MGYQNKSLFPRQISFHRFSGFLIQMVRGFVNQQKIIFSGKQHRQHHFRTFSRAQRPERPVQDFRALPQKLQLTDHAPQLAAAFQFLRKLRGGLTFLLFRNRIGKIIENRGSTNAPLIRILPKEQVQESRLSLSVASDQSQLPVRVDLERDIFKDRIETVLLCETAIFNLYK